MNEPEGLQPDWNREKVAFFEWAPERKLIKSIRKYQEYERANTPLKRALLWAPKKLCVLRHRFWSIICGADIPVNCKVGGGLILKHGSGVVIHPGAHIGTNCIIMSQVVIGTRETVHVPTIGDNVSLGSGAKILGGVVVGSNAKVGANAVVLQNVPEGALAVGVPARVILSEPQPTS